MISTDGQSILSRVPMKRRLLPLSLVTVVIAGTIVAVRMRSQIERRDASAAQAPAQIAEAGNARFLSTGRASANAAQAPYPKPAVQNQTQTTAVHKTNWANRFAMTTSYFDFISSAAPQALAGDGRAAFYIGKAVATCGMLTRLYGNKQDPEQAFEQAMADYKGPQWTRDKQAKEFRLCSGMLSADPFASLPPREDGYGSPRYWFDAAVAAKDPVAIADRADQDLASTPYLHSAEERSGSLQHVQESLNASVESGDPAAIFKVAMTLIGGNYASDAINAGAMALAACDLGYDCSANNVEGVFANCQFSGACPPGEDFSYWLQGTLGADRYAAAYKKAQEFEDILSRHDLEGMQTFTRLRGR